MDVINWLLGLVVKLINMLLPAFNLPENFTDVIDSSITVLIDLINGAAYFIPVNILLICCAVLFLVDSWVLIMRVGQWIIELIRG